jgi:alpha-beta hydrolase superfamily lysophospholipase
MSDIQTTSPLLTGTWQGELATGNGTLILVFHLRSTQTRELTATFSCPQQGLSNLPCDKAECSKDSLRLTISQLNISIEANLSSEAEKLKELNGTFSQNGMNLPLTLKKVEKFLWPSKPQEPVGPFPYLEEEVHFSSGNLEMVGTLTYQVSSKPLPTVVLVHGSGPHSRDQVIFGHKPFLLLADYLSRRGFAVLRYDKRGIGQSGGDYKSATSFDFADDALAAVNFLKQHSKVDPHHLGLLGHSEGGWIVPLVAAKSPDVKFLVLMAGCAIAGEQILLTQIEAIQLAQGVSREELDKNLELAKQTYAIIREETDNEAAYKRIRALYKNSESEPKNEAEEEKFRTQTLKGVLSPWYRTFITHDPGPTLTRVNCPVLALNGDKDLQVLDEINLAAIKTAMETGGNKNLTIEKLPGLNHLFQTCKTGLVAEYGTIEETLAPSVLELISHWLTKQAEAN